MAWYQHWVFNQPQVVVKLHAILRPFLLRRLKNDVEQMLPRKKEIILYATLTEHQKKFQDHLINKTLEGYLREKMDTGIRLFSIDFFIDIKSGLKWRKEALYHAIFFLDILVFFLADVGYWCCWLSKYDSSKWEFQDTCCLSISCTDLYAFLMSQENGESRIWIVDWS